MENIVCKWRCQSSIAAKFCHWDQWNRQPLNPWTNLMTRQTLHTASHSNRGQCENKSNMKIVIALLTNLFPVNDLQWRLMQFTILFLSHNSLINKFVWIYLRLMTFPFDIKFLHNTVDRRLHGICVDILIPGNTIYYYRRNGYQCGDPKW